MRLKWVVKGRSSLRKNVKKRIGKRDQNMKSQRMSRNDRRRRIVGVATHNSALDCVDERLTLI